MKDYKMFDLKYVIVRTDAPCAPNYGGKLVYMKDVLFLNPGFNYETLQEHPELIGKSIEEIAKAIGGRQMITLDTIVSVSDEKE